MNDETKDEVKTKKRVKSVSKDAKLTVKATENHKRGASADRFQAYLDKKPKTVQEALDAGLTMGDIHYDIIHGSIEVDGAELEEYTPSARGSKKASGEIVADGDVVTDDNGVF